MSDRPQITRVVLSEDHTRAAIEYADRPGKLYRVTATELDSPERQQEPVQWSVSLEQPLPAAEGWPASTPIYEQVAGYPTIGTVCECGRCKGEKRHEDEEGER